MEDKKINLPAQIQESNLAHERLATEFIGQNKPVSAEQEYRAALSETLAAQGDSIRYHKGALYHQIGYCLFLQKNYDEARKFFLYAFIEDCITRDNFPIDLPAFKNLNSAYRTSHEDLLTLYEKVRNDYKQSIPLVADDYLSEYFKSGRTIDSSVVNSSNKVFVGGNYRNIALLRYIEDAVRDNGLNPIMPINFRAAEDDIYLHAMLLLQDCAAAIFEITFDAGHLMEIERAMSFPDKRKILLLYQQAEKNEKHYTRMLWSAEVSQEGYMNISDLAERIKHFLAAVRQ